MAKVKFKSIALLTGGIFTLLFFHFVPVGLGNVTIVGKSNPDTTAINQDGIAIYEKQANISVVVTGTFETRYNAAQARVSYQKN